MHGRAQASTAGRPAPTTCSTGSPHPGRPIRPERPPRHARTSSATCPGHAVDAPERLTDVVVPAYAMLSPVHITTLGALAVDGRPVRGDRLVALVGALLDARGRTVSSSALAEDVWEGIP